MRLSRLMIAVAMVGLLMAADSVATAAPFELRTDTDGTPMVLWSSAGYSGFTPMWLGMTSDGKVIAVDTTSSGNEIFMLDPSLASRNDAATAAHVGYVRHWSVSSGDAYRGTVAGGVKDYGNFFQAGVTRMTSGGQIFGIGNGGTFPLVSMRLENSAGSYSSTSNTAAVQTGANVSMDTGEFKKAVELWGPGASADTWQLLVASQVYTDNSDPGVKRIRKYDVGALTGLGSTTRGTRSVTSGGVITDSSGSASNLMYNLVPDVADMVRDMAYNPGDGNLYFISDAGSHVYLSAISFVWGDSSENSIASYVDLDPNSDANYLDLTYLSSVTADSLPDLLTSKGLTFNLDGSQMFVSNGSNRVFIFDAQATPTPEPATLAMLLLGGVGVAARRIRRRRA